MKGRYIFAAALLPFAGLYLYFAITGEPEQTTLHRAADFLMVALLLGIGGVTWWRERTHG